MKLPITFITLLTLAFCTQSTRKESSKTDTVAADITIETKNNSSIDKELQETWTSFAKAVFNNDKKLIATLSTDCIFCCDCVTNTGKEEKLFTEFRDKNPDTWYEKLYKDFCYIPTEKFIKQDLSIIFDTSTKARLLDTSKIKFHNSGINKGLYNKGCIIKLTEIENAKLMEVLITIVDPSSDTEGSQKAFVFVMTEKGYRFCGYSTVP